MKHYINPNPRLGVLLRLNNASVRLTNVLRHHRLMGLKRFEREWPEARRRKELGGWGMRTSFEWSSLLFDREIAAINASYPKGKSIATEFEG